MERDPGTLGPVTDGVACMMMRGGTSKGAFFRREDLPAEPARGTT